MRASLTVKTKPSIIDILQSGSIVSHFQPILSARQKCIVGFEALTRGAPEGGGLIPPIPLFRMAEDAGVPDELDTLCWQQAVRSFSQVAGLSRDAILFLNVRVPAARDPIAVARELDDIVASAGLTHRKVGIEILEAEIEDMELVRTLVDRLRHSGFLVVLDDVGTGHSNLNRIPYIKPDVLKVDKALVRNLDGDYLKRSTLKSLVDLGRKIGALVVAEGVETEDEAMVALELGADLLQGFLLGRPADVQAIGEGRFDETLGRIGALASRFKGHMVETINERRLQHRRFGVVMDQILCDLTHADPARFDEILTQTIHKHAAVECVYILDHAGIQVTDTIWNPQICRRDGGALFHPAPRGADHSLKEYYYILLDVELHKYTTDPYVSLASGSISRTISTYFRDSQDEQTYVLCIDVVCV